ncbi:MAG: cAMP/cGMP-dependent 3',5'-cyclic-AMP/GMP phosphodiesterase [Spirochaetales bacterium]|nr:cAMP/cGMP-dependent 3',5'-cyclic-AMP/GMP phosphodiesterase [Spirochaetales bacterium]
MYSLQKLNETVTSLPRGGSLVQTSQGYIQVGSPPETIKDTMLLSDSVPQIFVLPQRLFNPEKGISLAELEFPIYFNFFIKKRKTTIIATHEQSERLMRVLQEAVFGPKNVNLADDVHISTPDALIPNIKKEMEFYKTFEFSDLLQFIHFENNRCSVNDVEIVSDEDCCFHFHEKGIKIASVPGLIEYKPRYDIGMRLNEPYRPPLFAVTCLGPSHGFDSTENTSGFIIWLNHRGVMIDPPVNSTEWLNDSNVNPKLIDSIILTHCHADHDAGTFQKIMEEGKITLYTTKTILNSFLRKYSALSGESIPYLMQLFDFVPVYIEKPFFIHGAEFNSFYSLHSIPTIGFKMSFHGQSFVYSSDHQGEPKIHRELFEKNIISRERYEQFSSFPWESRVIYHEAGIPPLHTAVSWLSTLPKDIQKKIYVYHIAKKDFPSDSNLTLCRFGMEHTVNFKVHSPPFEKTYEVLSILKHLDFFHSFPIHKVQEFFLAIKEETYRKGTRIIRKGEKGDKFYIIYSGNVAITVEGIREKKIYSEFEYFGEVALMTDSVTSADVTAETDVIVYTMEKNKFLSFIAGTEFEETLKRLVQNRDPESWNILLQSKVFKRLSTYQKTWIESVLSRSVLHGAGTLIQENEPFLNMFIIRDGEVEVFKGARRVAVLGKGDFVGELHDVEKNLPSSFSFRYNGDLSVFMIKREDILNFARRNPGLVMKFKVDF